jgi:hypothetical protein
MKNDPISVVPWKAYLKLTVETVLAFYIATFCIIMFFLHRGPNWVLSGIILGLLYLFVIAVCAQRLIKKLSMPARMLVIPIAPLLALIIVVTLIPIIGFLE